MGSRFRKIMTRGPLTQQAGRRTQATGLAKTPDNGEKAKDTQATPDVASKDTLQFRKMPGKQLNGIPPTRSAEIKNGWQDQNPKSEKRIGPPSHQTIVEVGAMKLVEQKNPDPHMTYGCKEIEEKPDQQMHGWGHLLGLALDLFKLQANDF